MRRASATCPAWQNPIAHEVFQAISRDTDASDAADRSLSYVGSTD